MGEHVNWNLINEIRNLLDNERARKLKLSNAQRVLVALAVAEEFNMTNIMRATGISWGNLDRILDDFRASGQIVRNDVSYRLADDFKNPPKLLHLALKGLNAEEIIGTPIDAERIIIKYEGEQFREGLEKVTKSILEDLPCGYHGKSYLNVEEDPCFRKESTPAVEHWFYCHGISTRLQAELGTDKVKDWVDMCNKAEIGEVVINDDSFAESAPWDRKAPAPIVKLKSHEYWSTTEPKRPEGYIVFGDKLVVISWKDRRCTVYKDSNLARAARNNVKIIRLGAHCDTRCCQEEDITHPLIRPNPDSAYYKLMWR